MCDTCREREERDRRFWQKMRRALLAAAKAIDERYPEPKDVRKAA